MDFKLFVVSFLCAGAVLGTCAKEPSDGFEKKFVMEESTGTWCGYCPRGIATIEYLKETYGDRFIAISLHGSGSTVDPMAMPDSEYLNYVSSGSFPGALLNRDALLDPYQAIEYFADRVDDRSDIKIDIDEVLYDEASGEVGVRCAITSCSVIKRQGVSIAIACIENDVQDDNPLYAQLTYFHKKYGLYTPKEVKSEYPEIYPYLEPYVTGEVEDRFAAGKYTFYVPASEMKHQEVARGIFPGIKGMDCTQEYPVNQPQHFTVRFTMPDGVMTWQNTAMVALLLKNSTGEILNADIIDAEAYKMSGITDVLAEDDTDAPEEYYTLQGLRIEHPTNGIYIKKKGKKTVKEFFRTPISH